MKAISYMASVLACVVSLDAQIAGTLSHLPDGSVEVRIRNNFTASLTAFVVTMNMSPESSSSTNLPFVVYSDPLIEPAAPLLAGEERVVVGGFFRRRVLEEPIVTAGIFEDGTTTGDAVLLNRLILRRGNMLQAVEIAIETLSDAGRRNVPRGQLIEQFKKMADSVRRWYLPPEQQIGLRVYQPIIGKLINLPEGEAGTAFPPATFVAQETARLREQRVALLESLARAREQPGLMVTDRIWF